MAISQDLPITEYLPQIVELLSNNASLILQAEPGAGKSTAVPLYLLQHLELENQRIVMLEPRRLATKALAHYLAEQLGEQVGQTIGYQVRNERRVSAQTRLEIITEGILTQRMLQDPELKGIGLIIFDEFHERSIHADLALTLSHDIRSVFNESLKVLVMSATIDSDLLSQNLNRAPVVSCQGRSYPVTTHFLEKPLSSLHWRDWLPALQKLVIQAQQQTDGDILVFLPGQADIMRLQQSLQEFWLDQADNVLICPLYGALKAAQQEQALRVDQQGRQKIVLATNIAETSLTIANISAVVDSGLEKVARYDVSSAMTALISQRISKAQATQRQGRAGRVQAGSCYRLWSESQHQSLPDYPKEEIITSDLTALQMALSQWGAGADDLQWLTAPPAAHLAKAQQLLQQLELIDSENKITKSGKKSVSLHFDARIASMLEKNSSADDARKALACDLAALLTDLHFYQQGDDLLFINRIGALQAYRQQAKEALKRYPLKAAVTEQIAQTAKRLARLMNCRLIEHSDAYLQEHAAELLVQVFPDRIAKQRRSNSYEFLLANGKGVKWPEHHALPPSEWIVVADLDGQRRDGRIYLAMPIDAAQIEQQANIVEQAVYRYEHASGQINGYQSRNLGAITLQQTPLQEFDQQAFNHCLYQALQQTRLQLLPWPKATLRWLQRVRWLMHYAPEQTKDWPDLCEQALIDNMDEWLVPYISDLQSLSDLKRIDIHGLIQAILPYELWQEVDLQAPASYQTPSGRVIEIDYQIGQLPKISVVLQELFGELASPQLAWGQQKLSFELLSPARRPIQVTADLANFWQSSYFEVAKEMRGRYPKHRWPEQPLQEKAGASIKRR